MSDDRNYNEASGDKAAIARRSCTSKSQGDFVLDEPVHPMLQAKCSHEGVMTRIQGVPPPTAISPSIPEPGPAIRAAKENWKPGQKILNGEFLIKESIGEGGMGSVWLAVRTIDDSYRFAVKRIRPTKPSAARETFEETESAKQRILAELKYWRDLPRHPYLHPLRFFRTDGDEFLLFSEYVSGGSLHQWIEKGRLTRVAEILDMAIQIAWGLHAIHQSGLVHADVKPDNILISSERVAKVTDFGISMAFASETSTGAIGSMMTLPYRSPEHVGRKQLTPATDQWSWGLTVLRMFSGRFPSQQDDGVDAEDMLATFLEEDEQRQGIDAMPEAVIRLLHRCFQYRPADRWCDLLETARVLVAVYRVETGRGYERQQPAFPAADRHAVSHDRWAAGSARWNKASTWLQRALAAGGREVIEDEGLLPTRDGSRAAQAIADLTAYEHARRIYLDLIGKGRTQCEPELADLLNQKAWIHEQLFDWNGALATYDEALTIYQRLVSRGYLEYRNVVAGLLQNKAMTLAFSNRHLDAASSYDQAIKIREHLVRKEGNRDVEPDLAVSYQGKATALTRLARPHEAIAVCDEALAIYERLVFTNRRHELSHELGATYQNRANARASVREFAAAVDDYDKALEIYKHLISLDGLSELKHELAMIYQNKSDTLRRWGNIEGAITSCGNALAILEPLVCNDCRHELEAALAMTWTNMANARRRFGDYPAAISAYDRSLQIYTRLVVEEGRHELEQDLAGTYQHKAIVLNDLRDYETAVVVCDRALEIFERLVCRENHHELQHCLAGTFHIKAIAFNSAGKLSTAIECCDKAQQIFHRLVHMEGHIELEDELALTHMTKAQALGGLGQLRLTVSNFDEALSILERLVYKQGRGELEADIAMAYLARANALLALGDPARASPSFDKALEIYTRLVETEGHREFEHELASACQNRALTSAIRGDLNGAMADYQRSIKIYERLVFGQGHDELRGELAQALAHQAKGLMDLGRWGEARNVAERAHTLLTSELERTQRGDLKRLLLWMQQTFARLL